MTPEAKLAFIQSKMSKLQKTIDDNNGYGPTVVIVLGFVFLLGLIGIPMIIIGLIWSHCNQKAREAAAVELKDAEKELLSM